MRTIAMFCVVVLVVLLSGCGQEAEIVEEAEAEPDPQPVQRGRKNVDG